MDALRSRVQPASERFESEPPFRIGGAEIDPSSREVTINGAVERIQPQPLRVLMLLLHHRGRVVTRDEIVDQCWDRRIVGDDVINRAILILRRLARRAGGFRIETIPRVGYRLVEDTSIGVRGTRTWAVLVIAAALILAAAAWLIVSRKPADAMPTVSVIPFTAASGGADATRLGGQVERAVAQALTESGFEIVPAGKADLNISGEVAAAAGEARVDVFLGLGRDGSRLMSTTFQRPSAGAPTLPLEIAADLAEILAPTARFLTFDGEMADSALASQMFAFLQAGRQGDWLRAQQIVQNMHRGRPDSVAAEFLLARTYAATLEAYTVSERREHVRLARAILERRNDRAQFGDYGYTWCRLHPWVWFAECERRLRESAKSKQAGDSAPQRLAELVADVGRTGEALWLARVAYAQGPYSSLNAGVLIQLLEIHGRNREAETVYAAAVRKWPNSWTVRWNRIMGLSARGDFAALERFVATIPRTEFRFDAEVLQSVLAAKRERDRIEMIRSCTRENLRWSTEQVCVAALADIGEMDASFAIARKLYSRQAGRSRAEDEELWLQQPPNFMLTLLSAPAGAPLRRDPRFLQLAEQTGLLRYWRSEHLPDFCTRGTPEPVCRRLRAAANGA